MVIGSLEFKLERIIGSRVWLQQFIGTKPRGFISHCGKSIKEQGLHVDTRKLLKKLCFNIIYFII